MPVRPLPALLVLLPALLLTACGGSSSTVAASPPSAAASASASADSCSAKDLKTHTSGRLTLATDKPAYEPWFSKDDPTNGQGYEAAVGYAVA